MQKEIISWRSNSFYFFCILSTFTCIYDLNMSLSQGHNLILRRHPTNRIAYLTIKGFKHNDSVTLHIYYNTPKTADPTIAIIAMVALPAEEAGDSTGVGAFLMGA